MPDEPQPSAEDVERQGEVLSAIGEEPALTEGPPQDEIEVDHTPIPDVLNLLPLRDAVLFPMLVAPLSVGRDASIRLIDDSLHGSDKVIGMVTQKESETDEPGFADVYGIGCVVVVRTVLKMSDATRMIVQGLKRFRIVEQVQERPYLRARIEIIPEPAVLPEQEEEVEALRRLLTGLFDQAVKLSPNMPAEMEGMTDSLKGPGALADLVAAHLNLSVAEKQSVLEESELIPRMRMVVHLATREVRILELTSKLHSEVNFELNRTQREYYLREQLKAIQRELGEAPAGNEDYWELSERLEAANLPDEAQREASRELGRLMQLNPASPEYGVVRTYLDTLASLPWSVSTPGHVDLTQVREVLAKEHFGLERVKQRILEFLAVHKLKGDEVVRQPILCLVGPPGVGKTSLGRSIASALQRKFVRMSLGGMRDESEIRGHRRTYIGAMPGQIIQMIRRAGANNPVFVLDEIDKLGRDMRGDPASALLEVLDPEQNFAFRDLYLDTPFDLRKVFFIATANTLDGIPAALLDRMEIIEIGGYTEVEKLEIAKRHLVPKQTFEVGLKPSKVAFLDEGLAAIIRHYTREAGVRTLERQIASCLRKVAMQFATGRKTKVTLNRSAVTEALGAPRYLMDEVRERPLRAGMALGMAWTAHGGDVLFIESAKFPGTKGLVMTGQMGDVMRESVSTALGYLRSRTDDLGIDPTAFENVEVHVHVPAGAVPKDGPSAGVTILSALASLFTGRAVRPLLAMTGEITLTGVVLPVGGIKEKVISAQRAGVQTIILPAMNRKDWLEEVPVEIRQALEVHFVERGEQVLELALQKH